MWSRNKNDTGFLYEILLIKLFETRSARAVCLQHGGKGNEFQLLINKWSSFTNYTIDFDE